MAAAVRWPSEGEADVRECVRLTLDALQTEPALASFLGEFLRKPGRLLGPTEPQWPRFVLDTAASLGGDPAAAAWVAAAVEFSVAAIDVADDLADGDLADDRLATIRAPAAGLALAYLAQIATARAAQYLSPSRATRVNLLLATGSLASCAGQDGDMLLEDDLEVNEQRAGTVSWRKSGALAAMACTVGAACATDAIEVIEAAGRFGTHAGMVAQLVNDIDGVLKGERGQSADIARRKKTLPIAFALSCAREESLPELTDWYETRSSDEPDGQVRVAQTVRELGGLHYTWAVAEVHRQRALEAVRNVEELTGRPSVRGLAQLVAPLSTE
jgi:geranylgeranyl pyrophosphate synthase